MSKSEVIRIPARARPVWARLVAKIRDDLGRELPESECFSLIISEWDMRTGGAGVLPDNAPFYEVMPEERKATGPEDLVNAMRQALEAANKCDALLHEHFPEFVESATEAD